MAHSKASIELRESRNKIKIQHAKLVELRAEHKKQLTDWYAIKRCMFLGLVTQSTYGVKRYRTTNKRRELQAQIEKLRKSELPQLYRALASCEQELELESQKHLLAKKLISGMTDQHIDALQSYFLHLEGL